MRTTALALMLAAAPAAALAQTPQLVAVASAAQQPTRLEIVATGHAIRTPDLATIGAGVVTQASKASDAMAANGRAMNAAIAALKRAGIADRDIATSSLSLQPQYRYADNQPPVLTGYQAINRLTVRFHDLKQAGPIIDTLVAQGINQIDGPNLSVERPEAALDDARVQAMTIARARGDLYAKAAGLRIKRIALISESGSGGPVQPPQPMMMAMREKGADASTAIQAGEQELEVTVNVTFELE